MSEPTPAEAAERASAFLRKRAADLEAAGVPPIGPGVVASWPRTDDDADGDHEITADDLQALVDHAYATEAGELPSERDRLRAENKLLLAVLRSYQPDACSRSTAHPPHDWMRSRHAAHCPGLGAHGEPPAPVDLLAPNAALLAEVRQLRRDLARARSDRDSWQELAALREAAGRAPDGEGIEP